MVHLDIHVVALFCPGMHQIMLVGHVLSNVLEQVSPTVQTREFPLCFKDVVKL